MNKKIEKILYLPNPRGFCAGVERAINIVELSLEKYGPPIYVRHEIVHNPWVVKDLEDKGVIFVDELDEIPDGERVIFSAHGVSSIVKEEANSKNMDFIDATCPLVLKVHFEAKRHYENGFHIFLIGHKGHPEVDGTMGQIPKSSITLLENEKDIKELNNNDYEKVALITQTTLSVDDTARLIQLLKQKFPKITEPPREDICYATTNRQEEVKRLVKCVDLILVVGSENSSNSQRLVDVAKDSGCAEAHLIEDHKKIDWGKVADASSIGITSGASAPDHLVKEVISSIQEKFDTSLVYDTTRKETIEFKVPPVLR
mgnify:CR=1 FL=1